MSYAPRSLVRVYACVHVHTASCFWISVFKVSRSISGLLDPYCYYYKLLHFSTLKQHDLHILQFWKSEVQNQSHWAKTKVSAGLVPPRGSMGRVHFLAFPASQGYLRSLAHGLFLHLNTRLSNLWGCCHISSVWLWTFCLPLVITLGPPG